MMMMTMMMVMMMMMTMMMVMMMVMAIIMRHEVGGIIRMKLYYGHNQA